MRNLDNESIALNVKVFLNNHKETGLKTSINIHVYTENLIMYSKHLQL